MKIFLALVGVAVAVTVALTLASVAWWALDESATCHEHGRKWGVVADWSPVHGCTATVLGTRVYL